MNEVGSKCFGTLSLKGADVVPLIENHAATRHRWSLNSITTSSEAAVRRRLPGFELMFQADAKEDKKVQERLRAYVAMMGLPFRVTVVTGGSGSYKEEDILAFLREHLVPWQHRQRWEIFILDAYAPGLTDNVQRLCWEHGYILITHGGGASMVAQTNDTDHHQHVRKRFIELQTELMIHKQRQQGGGLVDLTREENTGVMVSVMSDVELHIKTCKGYEYTGTTNLLNGDEDLLICREVGRFWNERNMRAKIDREVEKIERRFRKCYLWSVMVLLSSRKISNNKTEYKHKI